MIFFIIFVLKAVKNNFNSNYLIVNSKRSTEIKEPLTFQAVFVLHQLSLMQERDLIKACELMFNDTRKIQKWENSLKFKNSFSSFKQYVHI